MSETEKLGEPSGTERPSQIGAINASLADIAQIARQFRFQSRAGLRQTDGSGDFAIGISNTVSSGCTFVAVPSNALNLSLSSDIFKP